MLTRTVRDFRGQVASLLDGEEAVLVTRRGKPAAVLYPLTNPSKLPMEIRRRLFVELSSEIAEDLDTRGVSEEMLQQDFEAFRAEHRRRQ